MTAPFPTYPKLKRSFGGFNYGMYLALKALYNQVNNLTVIDPEEKLKIEALFNEAEKQIPEDIKLEDPALTEDPNTKLEGLEEPKKEDPKESETVETKKAGTEEPKKEEHKRGRPSKKKV